MKKLMPSLAAVLLTFSCFSQVHVSHIETIGADSKIIGQVSWGRDLLAQLSYSVKGIDTAFHFYYLDQNYKQQGTYKSIHFSNRDFAIKKLYEVMKSAFLPENAPVKQTAAFVREFSIGGVDVMLTNLRRLRDMQVIFSTSDGNVLGLTENQVDRLFGYQ